MSKQSKQEQTPKLSNLPSELWSVIIEEWRSRTAYGKALFPIWFGYCVLTWVCVLSFVLLVGASSLLVNAFEGNAPGRRLLPEVYKDE